ncbi:MAG: MarR family winged helix-turn-helix transcriptional regulator, partial [Solirubrobacteraceae bacterium]
LDLAQREHAGIPRRLIDGGEHYLVLSITTRYARAVQSKREPVDLGLGADLERLIAWSWWRLTRELPRDLSRTGGSVLKALHEDGPLRVTALAANEPVAQPTMSAIIQRLERRGLVSRERDPRDGRANLVAITAAGEEVMHARQQARARWLAEKLSVLSSEDRDDVVRAVRLLASVLAEDPPPES